MRKKQDSELNSAAPETAVVLAAEEFAIGHLPEMISTVRRLVEMETPTPDKAALDQCGQHLAGHFERLGGKVKFHRRQSAGNHLEINFSAARGAKRSSHGGSPILLLGHFDTVWELGTLAGMPFRLEGGRAWGPGVLDMKSGITMMMFALAALRAFQGGLRRPVTILLTTDEEAGSATSRDLVESVAKKSAAVLVCEPAQGLEGAVKTWRKGVGDYTIKVTGKAAHSGVDFEKGASAIVELARQITVISSFTDLKRGVTVNPGVIRGGTRTNVIAAEASAEVDVRIKKVGDAAYLEKKFRGLSAFDRGCKLEVSGGLNRPPMERSEKVLRLYREARRRAAVLGFELKEMGTGGGSDGNFTAALGIPTLDGLGGVGEGAHALNESIVVAELPRRAALLASMIDSLRV